MTPDLNPVRGPVDPAAWIPWAMGMTVTVVGIAVILAAELSGLKPVGYSHIPFLGFAVFGLTMATIATAMGRPIGDFR